MALTEWLYRGKATQQVQRGWLKDNVTLRAIPP